MESSSSAKPSVAPPQIPSPPFSSASALRRAQLATRLDDAKRFAGANFQVFLAPPPQRLS
ncbi:hypothetical protein OROGR_023317 [Orobanche gracilis]